MQTIDQAELEPLLYFLKEANIKILWIAVGRIQVLLKS